MSKDQKLLIIQKFTFIWQRSLHLVHVIGFSARLKRIESVFDPRALAEKHGTGR